MQFKKNVYEKIESLSELKKIISEERLVICDDIQNVFIVLNLHNKQKIGIAYYDYGIPLDICYSKDGALMYLGFGKNFLCINMCNNEVIINDKLQSIFYEILYDSHMKYICVICELDIYCYYLEKKQWNMGFRDIVGDCSITADEEILISCNDGFDYRYSLKNGELIK